MEQKLFFCLLEGEIVIFFSVRRKLEGGGFFSSAFSTYVIRGISLYKYLTEHPGLQPGVFHSPQIDVTFPFNSKVIRAPLCGFIQPGKKPFWPPSIPKRNSNLGALGGCFHNITDQIWQFIIRFLSIWLE